MNELILRPERIYGEYDPHSVEALCTPRKPNLDLKDCFDRALAFLEQAEKLEEAYVRLARSARTLVDHAKSLKQEQWASLPDVLELKAAVEEVELLLEGQ